MPASEQQFSSTSIEAPLQRTPVIALGALKIDVYMGRACLGETQLKLSRTEFSVLLYLAQRAGRAVPTSDLLSAVWKSNSASGGTAGSVKSCIRRLREKIEPDPGHPQYILSASTTLSLCRF